MHGKIRSTRPKIRLTQQLVERLISRGKKGDLNARRFLFRYWQDQHFVNRLVKMFQQLKGESGFTRIRPEKIRRGDQSLLYALEFSQPVALTEAKAKEAVVKKESKQKANKAPESKKVVKEKKTAKEKK